MINEEKLARIRAGEEFGRAGQVGRDLEGLDVAELLALRSEIDARLPSTSLQQMDLEKELVLQYHKLQSLQTRVLEDDRTPANQLAQVANAVTASLQTLVKMQIDVGRDEQMKRIETALLEAIETLPNEEKLAFFQRYEEIAVKNRATS